MSPSSAGPRVTMLVRNPFTNDTRVEREAQTLSDAGYVITIVADGRTDLPDAEERSGASVRRVSRSGPRIPGLRFLAHQRRLAAVLARTRPDILHAHDADALSVVGPLAAALGVPFVYDSHELWLGRTARGRSRAYDLLNRAYYGRIEARHVPRAAVVMVANPGVAPELERRYGVRDVAIVPNYPVEAAAVEPRDLRALPEAAAIPPDAPIVLYIGGIMPHRGLEQLVEAMTQVPHAHLVCLGAGGGSTADVAAEVERRGLAERAHLVPPVPSAEVVPYAASASVGVSIVQPASLSYRLALPNKLFQYMAAGIPTVASDFPDVAEVVEGSGAGVVVDPTEPDAVAVAIRGILDDAGRARAMGHAGRRAVTERFNWSTSARELVARYRTIGA
ncbi:MAG: glycosyltransferase family 4 protein [Chloroflexi bacterium]|nr:glycosyltransferase family 4 protein [Chloroflexota bacterium]